MTAEDVEKVEATIYAWMEEGDNSLNAMLGVLFALRNRVDSGMSGGSWLKNIEDAESHRPGQRTTQHFPDVRDPVFIQILQLVDEVYDGRRKDNLTGGAMYWARTSRIDPDGWFAHEIAGKPEEHPCTGSITGTTFYK